MMFVEAARVLRDRHPNVSWAVVGPDEGELGAVLGAIGEDGLSNVMRYEGALPYDAVAARMRRASIYVLPSVDEPFPMSLLEAMRIGVPSICTDSCGIAAQLAERGAALVVNEDLSELVAAIDLLLSDAQLRAALGAAAQVAAKELFSISAVVDQLAGVYGRATRLRGGSPRGEVLG
jgi:glycosyltransferase involved in cell wall biosynthesis